MVVITFQGRGPKEEDDPKPDLKPDDGAKSKNPFEKKSSSIFDTFLGTLTTKAKRTALHTLNAIVPKVPQYVSARNPCSY
jgi:hypothetical protein